MRISWRNEWPQWLLIAGMFVLAALAWDSAPARIPAHWNVAGAVDRYGGRFEGLLAIPLLTLGIHLLMLLLPRLDPGRANYEAFAGVYGTLRLSLVVVMTLLYGLVHLWIRGVPARIEVWVPLLVGALFVVVGNLLGKVRPNWFVGIRTPWTLSSKLSWTRTHRAARWVFLLMGLMLMACAVVRSEWAVHSLLVIGAAGVLGLTVSSYVLWRRDPEKTPPAGMLPAR
jgi:uncharacterized membrane protein